MNELVLRALSQRASFKGSDRNEEWPSCKEQRIHVDESTLWQRPVLVAGRMLAGVTVFKKSVFLIGGCGLYKGSCHWSVCHPTNSSTSDDGQGCEAKAKKERECSRKIRYVLEYGDFFHKKNSIMTKTINGPSST